MKTLMILPRIPYPPHDGAAVVMGETLQALMSAGYEVHVFALNTSRQHADASVLASKCTSYHTAEVMTDVTAVGAMRSIVSPRKMAAFGVPLQASYWVDRFATVEALHQLEAYVARIGAPDLVLCETLFTACYGVALRTNGTIAASCRVVLHAHNIEHRIQEHVAHESQRSWFERRYRTHLAEGTRAYETWVFQHLDGVITLSDLDAEAVRSFAPTTRVVGVAPGVSIASGVRRPESDVRRPTSDVLSVAHRLCFLGSLDWVPNVDGLLWFVDMVYPLIRKQVPDVVLHIGGRNPGYDVKALHDGRSIVVHDHVDDAIRFRVDHGINIVPLFSGSGVRIKILESFAAACPVVSTSRGAEGLPVVNGTHLLIEDDHRSFAAACVALLTDAARADAIAAAGHQLVREEFTWDAAIAKIMAFCSAP